MKNIKIRKATLNDVQEIHDLLSDSFTPYYQYFTHKAYIKTVVTPVTIKKRIKGQKTDVLVASFRNKIVGTASIEIQKEGRLHIRSMAIKHDFQNRGIGNLILEEIDEIALNKHSKIISLECFEPLSKAVSLYKKVGYKLTGKKRNYHGITIFEMSKDLYS
ncbi:MAG: GNAT family N-acetyltransferase [Candidatus Hodarchaeota archaeon]